MKRQHKKYARPRKPFDKIRIEEEDVLVEKYGLKNKKEIWKAEAKIAKLRNQAKKLIVADEEKKQAFLARLQKKGFKAEKIPDVLALDKEDLLKRRLQTIVHAKQLANTAKQARQFITHKHIAIGDHIVNIPSYHVSVEEEPSIRLTVVLELKKPIVDKMEEIKDEILEDKEILSEEITA
ncbi:MAG: hypothetical protein RL557_481 [archaeon]